MKSQMPLPLISFVIPTLNEQSVLEKTLLNISQYTGPYEIIISDGKSTDKTLEIAKKFNTRIIEHTENERQTIAQGRNSGAFLATGEFIIEMDADTRFPNINHFMNNVLNTFQMNPSIVGITTWFRVYPEDETLLDRIIFGLMGIVSLILNNFFKLSGTCGGEFQMIRTEAFKAIGGYRQDLVTMEDNEMFMRLRSKGKIYFETKLFIYHSGRRAHRVGWPRLIGQAFINVFFLIIFKKVINKIWDPIR